MMTSRPISSRPWAASPASSKPSWRPDRRRGREDRSEEHTSELQSLMRISYAVFCLKKKKKTKLNSVHKKKRLIINQQRKYNYRYKIKTLHNTYRNRNY